MAGFASLGSISAVAGAAILSFLFTGLATGYARRRGLLDHPGERHSHTEVTPRGGGAGLVLSMLVVSLSLVNTGTDGFWVMCVAPGVLILAATGWWDDHASLSARFRFSVQLAVTCWLLWFALGAGWLQGFVSLAFCGLFVIWMTNMYNFMDGSNGMAGLQGVFAGSVLAWLFQHSGDTPYAMYSLLLAACCLGFLPWNLGRARVFMGDVGSLALGFVFAALLLYGFGSGAFSLPVAGLVMLLFLTDSTMTLLFRVIRGERWYNAHRQHLYQRLITRGWAHSPVAVLYQVINITLVLPGILIAVYLPDLAWPVALALTLFFMLGWYLLIRRYKVSTQAG